MLGKPTRCLCTLALVPGMLLATACNNDTAAPAGDAPLAAVLPSGPQAIEGELGPGALYGLYLPAEWNGDLVLLVHGWTPNTGTVSLPIGMTPLRDALLASGWGVAWTSRSEGGMSLEDGVTRTRQLHALFTSRLARPEHTYLYGSSLGAGIVMELAETSAGLFDGVLTEAGIVGGLPYQLNYYFTARTLFDYFYPDQLPGDAVTIPEDLVPGSNMGLIAAIIASDLDAAHALAAVDQAGIEYATDGQLANALTMALVFNSNRLFVDDILARTNGHHFFGNEHVAYTGSADDAALNAGVDRFTAHPAGVNEIERMYSPSGKLTLPVINLHCRYDPVVPVAHTQVLADVVAARGDSELLFQWTPTCASHGVPMALRLAALQALTQWAETGVRPTGL